MLAFALSDEALTPLWFMDKPSAIPGVRWMVIAAHAAVLCMLTAGVRGFGLALASMLALANVVALAPNGLSALLFSRWGNRTNLLGVALAFYYLDQILVLLFSWFATRAEPAGERRYGQAAALVAAWGFALLAMAMISDR